MTHERPLPPRPLIESLPAAAKTAFEAGTLFTELRTDIWAQSYQCTEADVIAAWDRASAAVSPNTILDDFGGEGK